MKLILILFLLTNPFNDLNKVAKINTLKKEGKEAYINGNFEEAVVKYESLVNELGVTEDGVVLNLANAYFKNGTTDKATELYNNLIRSKDKSVQSSAHNQLGLLAYQEQQKEEAINHFKKAIKAQPSNEEARFNYTKLKKEIEEEQNQQEQEQDENQDQQDKEQQEQEQNENGESKEQEQQPEDEKQENEGDQSEEDSQEQSEEEKEGEEQEGEEDEQEQEDARQQSTKERLEEMNMSEEKAQMILEAMKNNEVQYIQQNRKKQQSQSDDGKPDW